jgi:hypothetical protein
MLEQGGGEASMYRPAVTIGAIGGILDPVYCLPRTVGISVSREGGIERWDDMNDRVIVDPSKLTLDALGVAVLFGKRDITVFIKDSVREENREWLNHLVNFITYKSRVNYQIYAIPAHTAGAAFNECPEVGSVIGFNIERLTQEKGIKQAGQKYVALGVEPCRLEVPRSLFDKFDKLIDPTLAVAIVYFLLAAENPLYFLVEYYKCYEVVRREFGGEKDMAEALTPYGFTHRMGKDLTQMANNHREPISFGRHAPGPASRVMDIDLRALYNRTVQRDLFDQATRLCRVCVDAYIEHLLNHAGTSSYGGRTTVWQ